LHLLKEHRARVLTAAEPAIARRRLAEAFEAFAGSGDAAWRNAA
jgi:hypothetical protein